MSSSFDIFFSKKNLTPLAPTLRDLQTMEHQSQPIVAHQSVTNSIGDSETVRANAIASHLSKCLLIFAIFSQKKWTR